MGEVIGSPDPKALLSSSVVGPFRGPSPLPRWQPTHTLLTQKLKLIVRHQFSANMYSGFTWHLLAMYMQKKAVVQ